MVFFFQRLYKMKAGVWGPSKEEFSESGRFWSMCAEQGVPLRVLVLKLQLWMSELRTKTDPSIPAEQASKHHQ